MMSPTRYDTQPGMDKFDVCTPNSFGKVKAHVQTELPFTYQIYQGEKNKVVITFKSADNLFQQQQQLQNK